MEGITKRFPGVVANENVTLIVPAGAFQAVIGENGAGKSTLLNILYGRYPADSGRILVEGEEVTNRLRSPRDAIARGIGLVSQHYALIPALSVLENVMLGAEPTLPGGVLDRLQAEKRIRQLADTLGIGAPDIQARADRLSVAAQQKIEILKALYRGAKILLLDEPTATLAPQEAEALFALLHILVRAGTTVVFVTHKLREVIAHSEAVTVLRAGRSVAHFATHATDPQELLQWMIGSSEEERAGNREQGTEEREKGKGKREDGGNTSLLRIEAVTVRNARRAVAVAGVSLEVAPGEIVGVAGVDGSGQRELSEAIVGLRPLESGRLMLLEEDISRLSVRARQTRGIGYISEDRHRVGMILDFSVAENYLLGHEYAPEWGGGMWLSPNRMRARALAMIQRYDVRGTERGRDLPARTLSGGNQQKVVIARALDGQPRLLVACQPTRGLDVEAARFVYTTLREARAGGLGILLFSLDLEEILALSDRIAVLFNGRLAGILPRDEADPEKVGALMTGSAAAEAGKSLTDRREEQTSGESETCL